MDMIIQTRSLFSDIPRQIPADRNGSYKPFAEVRSYPSRPRHWYKVQNTGSCPLFMDLENRIRGYSSCTVTLI